MKMEVFLRDINHGGNAPACSGRGEKRHGAVLPCSTLGFDAALNPRGLPVQTHFTNFSQGLPADALATGADPMMLTLGTNDAAATWASAIGGVRLNVGANPADEDDMMLIPAAGPLTSCGIIAATGLLFETMINIPNALADTWVSAGLNESITHVDPSATAGDGAGFLYAEYDMAGTLTVNPTTAAYGGLVEADFLNWILHQKVNGTDYFFKTDVPVQISTTYVLTVEIGSDLKPTWKINGVEVGGLGDSAASTLVFKYALTAGDVICPIIGRKLKEDLSSIRNIDIAYVLLSRFTV